MAPSAAVVHANMLLSERFVRIRGFLREVGTRISCGAGLDAGGDYVIWSSRLRVASKKTCTACSTHAVPSYLLTSKWLVINVHCMFGLLPHLFVFPILSSVLTGSARYFLGPNWCTSYRTSLLTHLLSGSRNHVAAGVLQNFSLPPRTRSSEVCSSY